MDRESSLYPAFLYLINACGGRSLEVRAAVKIENTSVLNTHVRFSHHDKSTFFSTKILTYFCVRTILKSLFELFRREGASKALEGRGWCDSDFLIQKSGLLVLQKVVYKKGKRHNRVYPGQNATQQGTY